MIGNIRQFLFNKKTLAVLGVLVVVGVGIGLRIYSEHKSQRDREMIEIAERLLNERGENESYSFTDVNVTKDELIFHQFNNLHKFEVQGLAVSNYTGWKKISPHQLRYIIVEIEEEDGGWRIVSMRYRILDNNYSLSLWDRTKKNVTSFFHD